MKPYACNNRKPFRDHVVLQAPTVEDGKVVATTISFPFRMRQDCSYTTTELGQADERCVGCSWRYQPQPTTPQP